VSLRGVAERIEPPRILVLGASPALTVWIEEEVAGLEVGVEVARSVQEAVEVLTEHPPPRPQIMAVDFAALDAAALPQLRELRRRGWAGTLIAIGEVPEKVERSLDVDHVLARPLGSEVFRKAVGQIGGERKTAKIGKLSK
jgi:hypothetical protein